MFTVSVPFRYYCLLFIKPDLSIASYSTVPTSLLHIPDRNVEVSAHPKKLDSVGTQRAPRRPAVRAGRRSTH